MYSLLKKTELNIVYKIILVQKQCSWGILQERCSSNMKKPTEEQQCGSVISTKPLCNFIETTPTHRYAFENHSTSAEESSLGEYLWGTASACQQNFKRIKLQFVFIYSYKKKFINTNNEQINK